MRLKVRRRQCKSYLVFTDTSEVAASLFEYKRHQIVIVTCRMQKRRWNAKTPADSPELMSIDIEHSDFSSEPRNLRIGFCQRTKKSENIICIYV
jgi:hypothetical protein